MTTKTVFVLTREDAHALARVRKICDEIAFAKYGDSHGYLVKPGDLETLEELARNPFVIPKVNRNLLNGFEEWENITFAKVDEEDEG